jgi:hypothetical protein
MVGHAWLTSFGGAYVWHVQEPAFLVSCGGEGPGEEEQWWEGLIPTQDAQLILTEAQTGSRGVLRDDVSKGQWPLQPLPRLAAQASLYEPHTRLDWTIGKTTSTWVRHDMCTCVVLCRVSPLWLSELWLRDYGLDEALALAHATNTPGTGQDTWP